MWPVYWSIAVIVPMHVRALWKDDQSPFLAQREVCPEKSMVGKQLRTLNISSRLTFNIKHRS